MAGTFEASVGFRDVGPLFATSPPLPPSNFIHLRPIAALSFVLHPEVDLESRRNVETSNSRGQRSLKDVNIWADLIYTSVGEISLKSK